MHGRLLVALLALACGALADELCFHDGTYVDGKIISTAANSVTFQPDSGATMTVPASRLDPRSFYHLRNESLGDDAKGRLALAQFAFDHRMYRQARVQFVRFRKLDPASADAFIKQHGQEIHEGIAQCLLEDAQADASSGNLPAAREQCASLLALYPDTRAAAEARTLIDTVQDKIDAQRAQYQAERSKRLDADRQAKLQQGEDDLKWADTIRNRALKENGPTQEKNTLDQAIEKYKVTIKRFEDIIKSSDDETLKKEAAPLLEEAKRSAVNCCVSNAQYYLSRGNYPRAKEEAKGALALDPSCAAAESVIQEAVPDGNGYWSRPWVRRG